MIKGLISGNEDGEDGSGFVAQAFGLIVNRIGNLCESARMLPRVVGTEEEHASVQVHPNIRLSSTGVAAVLGSEAGSDSLDTHISM